LDRDALKDFLDRKVEEYNRPSFIEGDPVSVPHSFTKKQDIEIAGFFAAIFAWGIRTTIINKCGELMKLMDGAPHDFIVNHREKDRKRFEQFCHRTFNATDLLYFISFLQYHYKKNNSLEDAFVGVATHPGASRHPSREGMGPEFMVVSKNWQEPIPSLEGWREAPGGGSIENALNYFYTYFFSLEHVPPRTRKHIATPMKNSACKRINMYLRWMVRNDKKGVDFGIWKKIQPSALICPLDLHVARVAKRFQLLDRPNPDWQSAVNLTENLRRFDPADPVKYDFALFALGVIEKF
jgi:uncharacterized protein (TIGR02757 family)